MTFSLLFSLYSYNVGSLDNHQNINGLIQWYGTTQSNVLDFKSALYSEST